MEIKVQFRLFQTGTYISEGDYNQVIKVNDDIEMDKLEGIQIMNREIGKAIGRPSSDIKIISISDI